MKTSNFFAAFSPVVFSVLVMSILYNCSERKPEPATPNPEIETLKSNQKRDSVLISNLEKSAIKDRANFTAYKLAQIEKEKRFHFEGVKAQKSYDSLKAVILEMEDEPVDNELKDYYK